MLNYFHDANNRGLHIKKHIVKLNCNEKKLKGKTTIEVLIVFAKSKQRL